MVAALLGLAIGPFHATDALVPRASRRQSYSGHHGVGVGLPVSHHHQQHRHQHEDQSEQLQGHGGHGAEDHDEDGSKDPAHYSFGYSVQVTLGDRRGICQTKAPFYPSV